MVAGFVFLGSESTIDAPRISGVDTGEPTDRAEGVPVVRVLGGAPPPSGPVRLEFRQGERVRFEVRSDAAIGIEIPGLGISETVDAGAERLSFRASRAGQFPVIVSGSHIGIASLQVSAAP